MLLARLKEVRESRGLTQKEVAERAGVDVQTVRAAERGSWEIRPNTAGKIARSLDITVGDLLDKAYTHAVDEKDFRFLHAWKLWIEDKVRDLSDPGHRVSKKEMDELAEILELLRAGRTFEERPHANGFDPVAAAYA